MVKRKNEGENKALFYFAVALLIVSGIVFAVNVGKIVNITGRATGTANLTIEGTTRINFTTSNINWASGTVGEDRTYATLNTSADANAVIGGNWTSNTAGLILENNGNVNITLDLAAGKTATTLLGGTGPSYSWNISNTEPFSCNETGMNAGLDIFEEVNTSARACGVFGFLDAADEIRIDIALVIPYDSSTGTLGDTITATSTAI